MKDYWTLWTDYPTSQKSVLIQTKFKSTFQMQNRVKKSVYLDKITSER